MQKCTLPTFIRGSELIGMAPSRGCGVCPALLITKERREGRGTALSVFQEPLEEGGAVQFSAHLRCLLSGLGLTVCLTLLTVAQQRVQHLSYPPFPVPKSLDHCWKLRGHTVITQ